MSIPTEIIKDFVKYSELIAAITATIYFYKYKKTQLRYLLPLIWLITIIEFIGPYLTENELLIIKGKDGTRYNLWLYNLLEIITFPTFFYIYIKSINNITFNKWVKFLFIGYILISILNWSLLQNFFKEWSELPYIYGSISLIITVIFYFIELLRSEKIIVFHRLLLFWISVGLLLFHTGVIPFSIKINGYALIPGIHELFLIMYILAIIMYLTFTFGFIWSKKESH